MGNYLTVLFVIALGTFFSICVFVVDHAQKKGYDVGDALLNCFIGGTSFAALVGFPIWNVFH